MRNGVDPSVAAAAAIRRISRVYPSSSAALVALNMTGDYGKFQCTFYVSFIFFIFTYILFIYLCSIYFYFLLTIFIFLSFISYRKREIG